MFIQTQESHFEVQCEYSVSKHCQAHVRMWIYCTVTRKTHYCLQSFEEKWGNSESLSAGRNVACLSCIVIVFKSSLLLFSFLSPVIVGCASLSCTTGVRGGKNCAYTVEGNEIPNLLKAVSESPISCKLKSSAFLSSRLQWPHVEGNETTSLQGHLQCNI